MRKFTTGLGLLAAAFLMPLADAQAQSNYPNQPVKIVAANTAGTAVDVMARLLAHGLSNELGQQFVVENRPGGGGTIGADAVVRSPHDGYTLLVISPPLQVITPNLRKNLPYDPFKSFQPISLFAVTDNVLVAHPKLPKTVKELVAFGKANPGKLKMGNGGTGFQAHLANLMFATQAGINALHVAYKGGAYVLGVAGGEVELAMAPLPLAMPAIRSGTVNAIAVASKKRASQLPDVPTFDEAGIKDFESGGWTGLVAPANVPKEVVTKLSNAITKLLKDEKLRAQFIAAGAEPWGTSPEETAKIIQDEYQRYGKIIRDNNITAN